MAITYYSANKLLDYNFGGTTYTLPTNLYFGLSTSAIAIDGSGVTEPSGNGYSRVALLNTGKASWSNASLGILTNTQSVTFPESTASWGVITYVFMADALTGGNIWWYEALSPSRQVQSYTTVLFAAGAITVQMTNT